MVTVSEETAVDYELTARIATEAFDLADIKFSPPRTKRALRARLRTRHHGAADVGENDVDDLVRAACMKVRKSARTGLSTCTKTLPRPLRLTLSGEREPSTSLRCWCWT
jgi:hypothetical protein